MIFVRLPGTANYATFDPGTRGKIHGKFAEFIAWRSCDREVAGRFSNRPNYSNTRTHLIKAGVGRVAPRAPSRKLEERGFP